LPDGQNLLALQSRPETVWSRRKKAQPKKPLTDGLMGIVTTLNNPLGSRN
jgi:pyruvate, water dikinase